MTAATILQVCFQKIIQAASLEEKKKTMFEMVAQYCVTMTARLLVLPWVLSGKCACCELKTQKKIKLHRKCQPCHLVNLVIVQSVPRLTPKGTGIGSSHHQ